MFVWVFDLDESWSVQSNSVNNQNKMLLFYTHGPFTYLYVDTHLELNSKRKGLDWSGGVTKHIDPERMPMPPPLHLHFCCTLDYMATSKQNLES